MGHSVLHAYRVKDIKDLEGLVSALEGLKERKQTFISPILQSVLLIQDSYFAGEKSRF